ncbi:MAG: SUMF1/EgtB/PvdO family nonheme iron enzyme, partial [bacterium]|nr:SUMF1/EgtB/PvdO family nonheme iron enzyme [bacterium]
FHDPLDTDRVHRVREFLMRLAFTMMERNAKSIEASDARDVLREIYPNDDNQSPVRFKERLGKLFEGIEPVCGLLHRLSSGEVQFAHLSFQEFLAAKYMLDMNSDYKSYLDNSWWRETLLLYTGLMNMDMKAQSNKVVREMIQSDNRSFQLLGAEALRDFQASRREPDVVAVAGKRLCNIIQSNAPVKERFNAGEILGYLGDNRIGIKMPDMVKVKEGKFIRGSNERESEKPIKTIELDAFEIGKYPVTNMEFKVFVDDGGYTNKNYWTPEGWKWLRKDNISEPGAWHDRKWNGPNFPVVRVSWYEAFAYARWLSIKTGNNYVLPTEAQWEKAARGKDGLVYPWGNDFDKNLCNSDEGGLNRTSPVGIFPKGKSPCGCLDMAGNVWEWCAGWFDSDYYKKSPAKNPKGPSKGSLRVIRGGGWIDGGIDCRTAFRNWLHPSLRADGVGFRLVRSF